MVNLKYVPSIDKNFQPNVVVLEEFEKKVLASEHKKISIYLERM